MPSKNTSHPIGTPKQDPKTKAVAVRCKNGLPGAWAVMTIDNGGHFASNEDVADWPVLVEASPATTEAGAGK